MKLKTSAQKKFNLFNLLVYSVCLLQHYSNAQAPQATNSKQPSVFYAVLGSSVVIPCNSGNGQYACFSSYVYANKDFKMAYLNTTLKYQINPGSIGVNNVKATDAGFYACSNDCYKMRIDQVSYFLQPMSNY